MKTKTIREWLNELPEPVRSKAISNAENVSELRMDHRRNSLSDAILGSFFWDKTPEGETYWKRLHAKLEKQGK